eukprot:TRINITY_DN2098_c0_g2_i1.p1 TRINITY_DN2098_c0_g2~~TRINITY_DN2098_c0_g2_i1.p1  ORF type:complete len:301 (-),score=113.15 TRINITY_DN2098_c0_g2_i1:452-1354(-)
MEKLNQIKEKFQVKESVTISEEIEGFPYVKLSTSDGASSKVYLYGAHVFSFVEKGGKETLFLSDKVIYKKGKGIRGGIPVCWPQFASEGPLPQHGFCRTSEWHLSSTSAAENGSNATAIFTLNDSEETRKLWNHNFQLTYTVELSGNALHLTLEVKNLGSSAFEWSGALHTYFLISDVTQTHLTGLKEITYCDKTKDKQMVKEDAEKVEFKAETDRVYFGAAKNAVEIVDRSDPDSHYRVDVTQFDDVVVWNPWEEKAKTIPDFDPSEWKIMICVEGTQLGAVKAEAGSTWTGKYSISKL